jgi:hypothetical protein
MNPTIVPLLESVVYDHPTYPFPITTIRNELLELLTNQLEFHYFVIQSNKKLKAEHPKIFSQVFLNTIALVFEGDKYEPEDLPYEVYISRIERLSSVLENMNVTRVQKDSPDGEMISAMK